MTIFTLVASHKNVDLSTVAHLANGAAALSDNAQKNSVRGMVVLSTCNRVEIYGETPSVPGATKDTVHSDVIKATSQVYAQLTELSGLSLDIVSSSFETYVNEQAALHLFTVTAGLESAVVGEREITGQVRRAISKAQKAGHATGNLVRLFDHAAHTARQVGQQTLLGSRGRSVVSVALDVADDLADKTWQQRSALIIGTGAYAGATVATLRERGCTDITVYSHSGRAATFASRRGVDAVDDGGFSAALARADLVVGCSGSATPLGAADIPAGKHVLVDLALSRDFSPEVADLPGVDLITLESVRLAAPDETVESVELAHAIVEKAAAEFAVREKARTIDSAIVALREHTMSVLEEELSKVRSQHGCTAASDQMEMAMRRMVKSLLHVPTVRARALAQAGRETEYISALEALYGIEIDLPDSRGSEFPREIRQADAS